MKYFERQKLTYVDYKCSRTVQYLSCYIILEWTTRLDTSSRTLFVREGGRDDVGMSSRVT